MELNFDEYAEESENSKLIKTTAVGTRFYEKYCCVAFKI